MGGGDYIIYLSEFYFFIKWSFTSFYLFEIGLGSVLKGVQSTYISI